MKIELLHRGTVVDTRDLKEGSHKIGRGENCDVQLKSVQVSKQHALLVVKGNKAAILDLGSSNGIFVNGILVKKQRIDPGDEVVIADYVIRVVNPLAQPAMNRGAAAATDGNAARNLNFESAPAEAAASNPQEKLLLLIDQRVLAPFYGVLKQFDWRWVLAAILSGSLVAAVVLSVIPIVRWGKGISTQESLSRAHTIVTQAVRENSRVLAKTNDFTRMTVETMDGENGVLNAFIVDPKTNTLIAPTKSLNRPLEDVHHLIALKRIREKKEDSVSIEKPDGGYVIAQPLYLFSQDEGDRALQAVIMMDFEIPTKVYSTFEPLVEAALFALLMSLLAYFLIFKMYSYPILSMQEQLDAALKGEDITVTSEAKSTELEGLATVINFAVSRVRQSGGTMSPVSSQDPDTEDAAYVKSLEEYDQGTTDGLLVVNKDKIVAFVGKVLDELIGLRNQYAAGRNISEAHRDPSFTGTVIDMADRVLSSLGETQTSQLEINGTSRTMIAVAHRNGAGEIRFIVCFIQMGGGR